MNRRQFIKTGAMVATAAAVSSMLPLACTRSGSVALRGRSLENADAIKGLDPDGYRILHYASLAPSGHNSQPWMVTIHSATEWIVGADPERRLPVVDSGNREVLLSIGAFIENLVQAAECFGYDTDVTLLANTPADSEIARIRLKKSRPAAGREALDRIQSRRTLKGGFLSDELKSSDVNHLSGLADDHLFYFSRTSKHAEYMVKEAVDNFVKQMNNRQALQEMAQWTRFKDADALKYRDGLTPQGMEITGLAGFYVRHFMEPSDVMSDTYIEKGIEKIRIQASQGAGWLVITSDGHTVKDLIDSGRRFQRMVLYARQMGIAVHPMTQTLEERQGRQNIGIHHRPTTLPQFMLRVGYVDDYPDPVTLRRPVEWFVQS